MLDAAKVLFTQPPESMRHCWQRACATLMRSALETQLRGYWLDRAPSLIRSSFRHQLLALPTFAGHDVAAGVRAAWYGLSRATHHHTYELPPTLAELVSWHRDIATLMPHLTVAHPSKCE